MGPKKYMHVCVCVCVWANRYRIGINEVWNDDFSDVEWMPNTKVISTDTG